MNSLEFNGRPAPAHDDQRPLVRRLGRLPADWRRRDLVELCLADGIRVVNFRYPSFDGKLREPHVIGRRRHEFGVQLVMARLQRRLFALHRAEPMDIDAG